MAKYFHKALRYCLICYLAVSSHLRRIFKWGSNIKVGFLVNEFFHEKTNRFGGYGMTIKYIAEYFNKNSSTLHADVILTRPVSISSVQTQQMNNANVIMRPEGMQDRGNEFWKYCQAIHNKRMDAFISVEHFQIYEYPLMAFSSVPWIIWFKDPHDEIKIRKIATLSLEREAWGGITDAGPMLEELKKDFLSFKRTVKRSRLFGRKVVIASELNCFSEIGKRLYRLKELNAVHLPKPIPLPFLTKLEYSLRPSFLFLARLDPIKRPWIFCELAKRFPQADFYHAGKTHEHKVMDKVMVKYQDIPNLKIVGRVIGEEKDFLLRNVWSVINTSVHEGLPVAFVEGFSYGKTVIACENPDGITERFGLWTGEMSGDGYDEKTLNLFSDAVEKVISGQFNKEEIGWAAREYIRQEHSFEQWEQTIREIITTNKHDYNFSFLDDE